MDTDRSEGFPTSAGILFGLGLGGFFDGIVLHQILQWHHLFTSAGYPPDSVENLKFNTLLDGLFHASTYIFTVLGLITLWRYSRKSHIRWSGKLLTGTFLMGFGIFNLVEGIIDHQLLGIHHVNETVPLERGFTGISASCSGEPQCSSADGSSGNGARTRPPQEPLLPLSLHEFRLRRSFVLLPALRRFLTVSTKRSGRKRRRKHCDAGTIHVTRRALFLANLGHRYTLKREGYCHRPLL